MDITEDQTDWSSRMASLRDEELIEIVTSSESDGYRENVRDAATVALKRRNLDPREAFSIEENISLKRVNDAEKPTAQLSNAGWLAIVIFGICTLPTLGVIIALYARGYKRKAKQAAGAMLVSTFLWIIIGMVLNIIFLLA